MHDHRGKKNPKYRHGMSGTKFHIIWKHINSRCNSLSARDYHYYGGRGIKSSWDTFEKFRDEMFDSFKLHSKIYGEENTTIERIDNSGNYSVENCRWATRAEQNRNTRRTNRISFNGKTQCLVDWAKEIGIKRSVLSARINTYKWPIDKALTTKVQ